MLKKVLPILLFLIILTVNLYSLSPILKSGFYFDDTYNSQTKSFLKYEHKSISDFNKQISDGWIQHGRIIPGFIYGGYAPWVYIFYNLVLYKIFIVTLHLLTILGFSFLLYKLSCSAPIFWISFLITPLFMQFRRSPDPVTSFSFLVPLTFIYLESSLIILIGYLKTNIRLSLVISLIFYLLMLSMFYEIAYVFFPIVISVIYFYKKEIKSTIKISIPYIILSLIYIGIYFFIAAHATTGTYNGSTINFDIKLIISTFLKQASASLPLSYLIVSKPQYFHINFFDYLYSLSLTIVTLSSLILYKPKKNVTPIFFSLGLLLIILSTLPIALSKRYQLEVAWGIGYLPVYIGYFGATSIFVGILFLLIKSLKNNLFKKLFFVFISIIVGITGFINLQNNKLVVEDLNYIFKYPRNLLFESLKSNIIDGVPKNSTIISLNELYWDNSGFYSEATNTQFKVVDLKSFVGDDSNDSSDLKILNNVKNTYVIKYRVINKDLGYVIIANVESIYYINKDEKIILVKSPRVYIKNNVSYQYLDYRTFTNNFDGIYKKNRIKLREINQIDSNELINFESIKLINPNNSDELNNQNGLDFIEKNYLNGIFTIWQDGFSGLEGNVEDNWRWATNKNKLSIINLGHEAKTFKIRMSITTGYKENSYLNITNKATGINENIIINFEPTIYENIIYLMPDLNELNFISNTKKISNKNDPRDLRFKISNFVIEPLFIGNHP